MKSAQVHRFQNFAAISLPGSGETVYLLPEDARAIADALRDCAADIRARGFAGSQFRTRSVPLENEGSRFHEAGGRHE